jgi:hypothetical protein
MVRKEQLHPPVSNPPGCHENKMWVELEFKPDGGKEVNRIAEQRRPFALLDFYFCWSHKIL